MTFRITAHAGDMVKGMKGAAERDRQMSVARKSLDWEQQMKLALDPERTRLIHTEQHATTGSACSMCGKFYAMELVNEYLGVSASRC